PQLPVGLADRIAREEPGEGKPPQRYDQPRADQFDLAQQVLSAGFHLVGHWVAVVRRAALEDVRDVDLGAPRADRRQQLVQELARRSHERASLLVFVVARSFADEHYLGGRGALARDRLRPCLA